jgi:hypothetical protein
MRFESATVPAAVMPDHVLRDDGFVKYLPLWCKAPWEGFRKPPDHKMIPTLNFPPGNE